MMIRTIFVAAAALAVVFVGPRPAKAQAPWCAVISMGTGDVHWDCQYHSFEACNPSPYYAAGSTRKRSARPY